MRLVTSGTRFAAVLYVIVERGPRGEDDLYVLIGTRMNMLLGDARTEFHTRVME